MLIVAAIVGLLAYGGYSFWNKDKKTDINNLQQVEDNINETRQNPVELHNIKMKATEEINKINQTIKEQASSTDNYLE